MLKSGSCDIMLIFVFVFYSFYSSLTMSLACSNKVDVWSIGIIFYQMLFGKRPFGDGQSQEKVLSNSLILEARVVRFPQAPIVSDESRQFIQLCLTYEQQNRPTISDLCKHPYIVRTLSTDTSNL